MMTWIACWVMTIRLSLGCMEKEHWRKKARFKVVVSVRTFFHHSKVDGWRIYTFSRHRLFDALKKHQISGVMYMSGDIQILVWEHHESEVNGLSSGRSLPTD